jgi:hypothetical protein
MVNRIEDLPHYAEAEGDYIPVEYQCIHLKPNRIYRPFDYAYTDYRLRLCPMCKEWYELNFGENYFQRQMRNDTRHHGFIFYQRSCRERLMLRDNVELIGNTWCLHIKYHFSEAQIEAWMTHCPFYRWVEFHDLQFGLELSNKLRVVL